MSLRAEFEAASPDLVLGPTLSAMPSLDVTVERQYAIDPARPIFFCWVRCPDLDRLKRTLDADATVDTYERIDRTPDRVLFRVRRSDSDVVPAYRHWVSAGGELLDCHGTDGRWEVTMRFPDRESFTRYHEFLESHDVEIELVRLADSTPTEAVRDETLTAPQREAITLAFEHGFFEVPRETTLSAIGEPLDISNQAVSERLRRAQSRLIDHYLRSSRSPVHRVR